MTFDRAVRAARTTDAAVIARIHRVSRASYYGTEPAIDDGRDRMWSQWLDEAERITFLAGLDPFIGFVSMTREPLHPGCLHLTSLYVDPEHFDAGVGSLLYDVFVQERRAGERGLLEVWDGNDRAIVFYEARGWRRTEALRPGPRGRPYVTYTLEAARP